MHTLTVSSRPANRPSGGLGAEMARSRDQRHGDEASRLRRELAAARELLEQTQHLAGIGPWRADVETREPIW